MSGVASCHAPARPRILGAMRILRGMATALLLVTACGDNIHPGGGELLVSPQTGLLTSESGTTATFTVALTNQPWDDVVIDLASSNEHEGTVTPSQLTFTRQSYNTPQAITV